MSPSNWGPSVWVFFHTLVSAISTEGFELLKNPIYQIIYKISSSLPCPECALHAVSFMKQIKIENIKTKSDFKNIIYLYHNGVNAKLKKPLFHISNIDIYDNLSIIEVFNKFVSVFNTSNARLMSENLQRKTLLTYLHSWIVKNIKFYIPLKKTDTNNRWADTTKETQDIPKPTNQDVVPTTTEPDEIPEQQTNDMNNTSMTLSMNTLTISSEPATKPKKKAGRPRKIV